jgi:hypothetical protein
VFEDQLKELNAANGALAKLMADVEAFNKANAGRLRRSQADSGWGVSDTSPGDS